MAMPGAFQVHGGRLAAARALYGEARWLDLSTGINPRPYPVPSLPPETWQRLPDPAELAMLEASAAGAFGLDGAAGVVAIPGSEAALHFLPRLRRPSRVAIVGPTYGGHAAAWADHATRMVPAGGLEAVADRADVVVLVNPNNPDGRILPAPTLRALAAGLHARGGWLVVDEAFADAQPETSLLRGPLPEGLLVLRSFGKFYGLAGLRLGFLIAWPAFAEHVRAAIGDWPVSGPAIAIATAAYRDEAWRAATRDWLTDAARKLDACLVEGGLAPVGGTPLFRLVRHPDAARLFDHLARAAILTRPFDHDPTLLRFGLPADEAGRQRLAAALQRFGSRS